MPGGGCGAAPDGDAIMLLLSDADNGSGSLPSDCHFESLHGELI